MCGIAGYQGDYNESYLRAGLNSIGHRGPDASDTWFSPKERVGLGHCRLSIIDISSAANQPMKAASQPVCLTYNGELYNYKALKNELVKKGHHFSTNSDTEVLLNGYLEFGPDVLGKMEGIFAFAIWDGNKDLLFLARDEFGIKPLYYTQSAKGFAFSSELKSLCHDRELDKEIDAVTVASHLTYIWSPSPRTMFKSVKKLEPGNALIVKKGRVQKQWQYYVLPDGRVDKWRGDESTAIQEVRASVNAAVEKQMVSDVPVGAFLSGGLDSSAIVSIARKHTDKRFQCFTMDLKSTADKDKDGFAADLPYAKKVANHLDVDLNVIQVGSEIANQLEKVIWHLDEPQADPAAINTLLISELASQMGIKVLLSGAGGDDVFTGYRRHRALQFEKNWSFLPASVRNILANGSKLLSQNNNHTRRISKALNYAGLSDDPRLISYFYWMDPSVSCNLLSDEYKENINQSMISEDLLSGIQSLPGSATKLDKMLFLEKRYFLTDHNLNYTDKMTMANGVETRVPLLDPSLVRLAASLPDHLKQRGNVGKWIFKEAMRPNLPPEILFRPKTGFGAPIRDWLKNELFEFVRDHLSENAIRSTGIFSYREIAKLLKDDAAGRIDASYTILSILCIQIWHSKFKSFPY